MTRTSPHQPSHLGPPWLRRWAFLLVIVVVPLSCDDDGTGPAATIFGAADLSSYVAIGNSATMGVLDGALLQTGSMCSYPALLANSAGLTDFELPLFSDPGIVAFPPNEVGVVRGGRMAVTQLSPLVIERRSEGSALNPDLTRPYNNLGVSNALLAEALAVTDGATSLIGNSLFDRVFRGFGTWAEQAALLDATFITLWLGNNDVLIWAGAGGDESLAPGLPVPVPVFAQVYGGLLDELLAITEQIVLFTLPDLTTLPVFKTIPSVIIDPDTGEPVLDDQGLPVPLLGPQGPLAPSDLVILTASPLLLQGVGIPESHGGTGTPLPDAVVLDVSEQGVASSATMGYNEAIYAEAAAHQLAVVDVAALLEEIATGGVVSDGETLTADYLTGGAFGLDGVHPTCKGYGLVANRLIDAINSQYGAAIPPVSTSSLEGVLLPEGPLLSQDRIMLPRFKTR